MAGSGEEGRTIVGTFADSHAADLAAEAARKAGFAVERRPDGAVVVNASQHEPHVAEVQGILGAYGAREFPRPQSVATTQAGTAGHPESATRSGGEQRIRADEGAQVELVEEHLQAHTQPVQTGEVTIRREVVTEQRTIEVPISRQELVIEHHPVDRQPLDTVAGAPTDPLIQQLLDRLRHMQPGEVLRIPIIEEEVIVSKRPMVVEEITLGKRSIQDTRTVSETVRREEVRIEPQGDVRIHQEETAHGNLPGAGRAEPQHPPAVRRVARPARPER